MAETDSHDTAVAEAANAGFTAELPWRTTIRRIALGEGGRINSYECLTTRPGNAALVATRVVPLVQHAPAARLGDHDKQVSWLAA
jgi:hypothetical protein